MKTGRHWRLVIVGFTIAALNVPTAGQSTAALAITDALAVRTPQSALRGPGFGVQGARLRGPRAAGRGYAGPDSGHSDLAWPRIAIADPTTLGFTKSGLEALDARMAQAVADGDTAGMTIVLLRHGQVAAFRSYGQQKPDTPMPLDALFRIYSMTKPITGVAMMQLYERGKWRLDDLVAKHVPEFANLKVLTWNQDGTIVTDAAGSPVLATPKNPPTMRQLMSHTAGFGYGLSGTDPVNAAFREVRGTSSTLEEMMKKVAGIPLLYEPGTRWYYSIAVDIQGYIVQKLSGQKFGDYLKQHIFDPLGMPDTAFYVTPQQKPRFTEVYHWDSKQNRLVMNSSRAERGGFEDPNRLESGGGGLVGSTHDYARFCQMFLNKGELGGRRVLRPETIALMTQNHIGDLRVSVEGTQPQPGAAAVRFGLDFAVHVNPKPAGAPYGKGTYYWGGAAGTWFWVDPVNDLAFVGMIQNQGGNRPGGMNFRADSARLVYAALADAGPASSRHSPTGASDPRR